MALNKLIKMKLNNIIVFCLIMLIYSCEKKDVREDYPIKAIVLTQNIDCHEYEIKILNDLEKVISLFGKSVIDSIYIAGNLPDNLKVKGLEIVFNIDKPSESIVTSCSMMGPSLNWIWISNAKPY